MGTRRLAAALVAACAAVSVCAGAALARAPEVTRTTAGSLYSASAEVRGRAVGETLCLRLRESRGREVGSTTQCVLSSRRWQRVRTAGYAVRAAGDRLDASVYERLPRRGDSFEVGRIRLVGTPPAPVAPSPRSSDRDVAHRLPWYSASSPFNQPIAADASADPGSVAMVRALAAGAKGGFAISAGAWTTPVYYALASTPRTSVSLTVSWAAAHTLLGVPIPADAQADPSDDHHLTVLDASSGCEYDFWGASRNGDGTWSALWGNALPLDGTGVFPGGWAATAAGFANGAGKIRPEELAAGHIDHALIVGIPNTRAGGPVLPATSSDGRGSGPGTIPEGARLQLDPILDLATLGLAPWQLVVARALQRYGMIVGDTGGTVGLSAVSTLGLPAGAYPWGRGDYAYLPTSLLSRFRVLTLPPQYSPHGYLDPGSCGSFR